ncbi:hypothetical protein NDU88_005776 [Pleurodeles waltl]|uniref:Uncharacterized protein n=1 Tax=Pleurodeles waltl TaxID=8319 RepID=A0AAV7MAE2_PLEWA|nr:hypothetical protein NDU88_005776 [Pleurodeles waltl]
MTMLHSAWPICTVGVKGGATAGSRPPHLTRSRRAQATSCGGPGDKAQAARARRCGPARPPGSGSPAGEPARAQAPSGGRGTRGRPERLDRALTRPEPARPPPPRGTGTANRVDRSGHDPSAGAALPHLAHPVSRPTERGAVKSLSAARECRAPGRRIRLHQESMGFGAPALQEKMRGGPAGPPHCRAWLAPAPVRAAGPQCRSLVRAPTSAAGPPWSQRVRAR